MQRILAALLLVAALVPVAQAQVTDDPYTIMRPEPWLAPKYRSPRGTPERVEIPRPRDPSPVRTPRVPPPVYVPETGRLLPNLPALPGAGPGGAETAQDRAARCAHQAGVYGAAAGDRNVYIGSCINQ